MSHAFPEQCGFRDPIFQEARFQRLLEILHSLGSAVLAFSGGTDSTFLLRVARTVLGDRVVPVLARSESLDQHELDEALRTAGLLGVPLTVVETREYDNPAYLRNDGDRCYHCKAELFTELRRLADRLGIPHILDGSNADDTGDYRPGFRARNEHGVRSPLEEAGLDKASIRRLSRALSLPTWDKPAAPCLSSRIPYGTAITGEKLRQVEAAEKVLRDLGFRVVRVRHHDAVARIEIPREDFPALLEPPVEEQVVRALKRAGFRFIAVDLEGFRSGSLNAALTEPALGVSESASSGKKGSFLPLESIRKIETDGES